MHITSCDILPPMLRQYDAILFDADETLFQFDVFRGLQHMFTELNAPFAEQDYQHFLAVNKPLWVSYQLGKLNANDVQTLRFEAWSERFNISSHALNHRFIDAMANICDPQEGAIALLNKLKGVVKMGIVTNGFTQMQQVRLERLGLQNHFDAVVIAEQVGLAKPDPAIFDHTLNLMNLSDRNRVLMIGDTLESDILGGLNAGLKTCWFNPHQKTAPSHVTPHFQVSSFQELDALLQA